jgi:DNA polymerase-3 subunit epsilon
MIEKTEFTVVDVETTGLFPGGRDRIIEIAIDRADLKGNHLDSYVSLVNPLRDIGATHIHGISARDVQNAPVFEEIAGDVLSLLAGAVFVAHNVTFDKRFIQSEMMRLRCELPDFPCLCTMRLAHLADPAPHSRKLHALCDYFGVTLKHAHSAYADVLATTELMATCIAKLGDSSELTLSNLGVKGKPIGKEFWPTLPVSGKSFRREDAARGVESQPSYIEGLIANLPSVTDIQPEIEEYLALLDNVLEDRLITPDEGRKLYSLADGLGLLREQVIEAHHIYMRDLIGVALEDHVITESEQEDLDQVRRLLSISHQEYGALLDEVEKHCLEGHAKYGTAIKLADIQGKSVCFTGTFTYRIGGEVSTRSLAEKIATEKGMIVRKTVVKGLDYLVAADPDSMSGKAGKARKYGIRIIAELVFWRMVGVEVFCKKVIKRKILTDKGKKTESIKLKSREIDVPVLKQTFYALDWGSEPLPTVWREIHKYVEALMGKKYKNDDTFVTTAPIEENRTEIVNDIPLPLGEVL